MNNLKDFLQNKKVVFYGDSITHNWEKYTHDYELTHPEDESYPYGLGYGYVKMLNDACHFKSVDNFAVSGGCYENCSALEPSRQTFRHFPYQVNHSIDKLKDAEVIFIMFGTNDYTEQVPFGNENDVAIDENQSDMTFFQGINYGFSKIKKYNEKAEVFVIGCLNR
ncbi:MAG: SGNH/GDSL hydrolase family protein, partial [Erysipelotrichaceae bacterium]|nr:SGNH/GDSL hydrolase family protein [Erysipelotrichaceae bacterium]